MKKVEPEAKGQEKTKSKPRVDDHHPVAKTPVPTSPPAHPTAPEHYHRYHPHMRRSHHRDSRYHRYYRDGVKKALTAESKQDEHEIFDLEQEPQLPVTKDEHHSSPKPAKAAKKPAKPAH